MNPTTKAAVIEALQTGIREINMLGGAKEAVPLHDALKLLRAEPEPTTEENSVVERERFEADAEPMGFDLTRRENICVEPWDDYRDVDTGHRWGGWLARASLPLAPKEPT